MTLFIAVATEELSNKGSEEKFKQRNILGKITVLYCILHLKSPQ
jgi:hypothetical protein